MIPEIDNISLILESFLGASRNGASADFEMEFGCPRCMEKYGPAEQQKYNLGVNIRKGLFKCWKCESEGDVMKGSVGKLIRTYGNPTLLEQYKKAIHELRTSELYKLKFGEDDFKTDVGLEDKDSLEFPDSFVRFEEGSDKNNKIALKYLFDRGIGWNIIKEHGIGFTRHNSTNRSLSDRIIIPSHDEYGYLNYWTGRDFTNNPRKQKYFNPKLERKNIIFNEDKIQWDADITIVEGPFDHIVTPNSIPLLGKVIKPGFKIYDRLMNDAKAKVNIFLDGDARETAIATYKALNHGDLYRRVRLIPVNKDLDPAKIYELYGYKGIAKCLRCAVELDETKLLASF